MTGVQVGLLRSGRSSSRDRPQARQVEHAPDLVAVVLAEADAPQQDLAGRGRHRPLDLEADGLAEAPPAKLLLDRHEEIVGLVLLERQVGVAGHPEQVVLEDLHAREQHVEVRLDDLVDQDEVVRLDLDEARQDRRDLDPGEPGLARLRDRAGRRRSRGSASRCTGTGWPGSTASGVSTG